MTITSRPSVSRARQSGLTLILSVAVAWVCGLGGARAAPSSALLPPGLFSYDASSLNNPYLRSNNFYGFDKLDTDADDRWSDLFGDFHLPILANIGVAGFYDDNVLFNNLNRVGSFGTRLTPSLTMPFGSDKIFTTLNYALNANVFENVSYANTVSNFLNGSTSIEFDHRNHLVLSGRGAFAQDPIGTMFSQGAIANVLPDPNTWSGYGFDAAYRYGGDGAKGNILMNFSMDNREYSNNKQYTYQRDLNSYKAGGAFLWRVMPKTQLLFEAEGTFLDYLNPYTAQGGTLNGTLMRFYTGATWQASAKTRAVAKVGYQQRNYDDSTFRTQSGPAFQGMLSWQPGADDAVWAEISNAINEALIGGATATNTQTYTVNWRHQWLERFNTQLGGFYLNQTYVTTANLQNNTAGARVSAYYTFRPGVWADLNYTYTDRSSDETQFDFTQNLVFLNFRMLF